MRERSRPTPHCSATRWLKSRWNATNAALAEAVKRGAKGRVRSLGAEGVQVERKLQLARDQVVAEVRDARSALRQTWLRLEQNRKNVQLAGEIEQVERFRLEEGESDLLTVNIREQQTARAAATLVDVLAEHFRSLAEYRASLGVPYDEVLR